MIGNGLPGVVKTTSTPGAMNTGAPKTVASIIKLEQFLVTFYDETGAEHTDVLVRLGDKFYATPMGEQWCAKLGPAVSWLGNEVGRRVLAKEKGISPEAIPTQDAVNVTGSRLAEETKKVVESR